MLFTCTAQALPIPTRSREGLHSTDHTPTAPGEVKDPGGDNPELPYLGPACSGEFGRQLPSQDWDCPAPAGTTLMGRLSSDLWIFWGTRRACAGIKGKSSVEVRLKHTAPDTALTQW